MPSFRAAREHPQSHVERAMNFTPSLSLTLRQLSSLPRLPKTTMRSRQRARPPPERMVRSSISSSKGLGRRADRARRWSTVTRNAGERSGRKPGRIEDAIRSLMTFGDCKRLIGLACICQHANYHYPYLLPFTSVIVHIHRTVTQPCRCSWLCLCHLHAIGCYS